MGKYDDALYEYLTENEKFADFFNGTVFEGKEILKAGQLENDSERYVGEMVRGKADKKGGMPGNYSRYRDIKKRAGNGARYAVVAIENLGYIDQTIPWRVMEYDVLEYGRQIREIEGKKRYDLESRGMKYSRFESGFGEEDRLYPVYTVCFYHGSEKWNGPRKLSEMMDFGENAELRALFHDYLLTLVCVEDLTDLSVFQTDLRLLLGALSVRKDKKAMKELFEKEEFRGVSYRTAKTIAIMVDNDGLLKRIEDYEEEEDVDMCQAMQELMQDWRQEGIEKGIEAFVVDYREEGFSKEKTVTKLMKRFGLSEKAAEMYYEKFTVQTV